VSDWNFVNEGLFVMSVNRINSNSDLLPNHRIDLILKDDNQSIEIAFVNGLELSGVKWAKAQQPIKLVDFLFGRSNSGPTMSIASVSKFYKTPQMSCYATNTALSDKSLYNTFSRIIPSDKTQSCAWAATASFFNWTNVGVISSKTSYGLGLAKALTECAPDYNVTVVWEVSVDQGKEDHTYRLQTLKNIEVYVIFIAMHNDDAKSLVDSLKSNDLIGYPYVWISGDTIGDKLEDWNQGRLPGLIFTVPYQPPVDDGSTEEMVALQESWEDLKLKLREKGTNTDQWELGTYAPYCWDIALVIRDYFSWFIGEFPGENITGTSDNYTAFLKNYRNFVGREGASGDLEFDDNLDPAAYKWTLMNCNWSDCYEIGFTGSDGVELYEDLYEDGAKVFWPRNKTGVSNCPSDRISVVLSWIYIDDHIKGIYAIFCGFTVVVLFVLMVLSHRYRKHAVVKMTSWRINLIMLCGLVVASLSFTFLLFDEKYLPTETLDLYCGLSVGTFFTGFSIFIGAIYTKVYRIHSIFLFSRLTDLKKIISDRRIIEIVVLFTLTNVAIVIVWAISWPFKRVIVYEGETYPTSDPLVLVQDVFGGCSSENSLPGQVALFAVNGYLLVMGAKWAWQTRSLPSRYSSMNESVQAGYIFMFIFLITGFLLIIFTSAIWKPNDNFCLIFFSYLLVAWFTISFQFIYTFYKIWRFQERSSDSEDDLELQSTTHLPTGEEWIMIQCVKCKENFTRLPPICFKCDNSLKKEVRPKASEHKNAERKSLRVIKLTTDELLAFELSDMSPKSKNISSEKLRTPSSNCEV